MGLGLKSSIHNIGKFFLHKSIGNFFRVIFFVFLAFELESATDSPYIYYLSFLVHRFRKFTVKTDFDTPGRFNQSCHLTASILSIVLCQALIKWGLTKNMGFSFPNSWYSFSWEVPLIAPVSLLCWTIHFLAHHRSHHHSRDGDLQKNGRSLMKQSEEEFYSVYK